MQELTQPFWIKKLIERRAANGIPKKIVKVKIKQSGYRGSRIGHITHEISVLINTYSVISQNTYDQKTNFKSQYQIDNQKIWDVFCSILPMVKTWETSYITPSYDGGSYDVTITFDDSTTQTMLTNSDNTPSNLKDFLHLVYTLRDQKKEERHKKHLPLYDPLGPHFKHPNF